MIEETKTLLNKTINNHKIMAKTSNFTGLYFYVDGIRIDYLQNKNTLNNSEIELLANFLGTIYDRIYEYAEHKGFENGFSKGMTYLQNEIKNLLHIQ